MKVAGVDVLSVGAITASGDDSREICLDDGNARQYRKVILAGDTVQGAIVIGHPELFDGVSAAVTANMHLVLQREFGHKGC